MKRPLFYMVMLFTLLLTACSNQPIAPKRVALYALDITITTSTLNQLSHELSQIEPLIRGDQPLTQLYTELLNIRDEFSDLLNDGGGSLSMALISADTSIALYRRGAAIFRQGRSILESQERRYTPDQHRQLRRINTLGIRLDATIKRLLNAPNGTDITHTTTELLSLAAGVARLVGE